MAVAGTPRSAYVAAVLGTGLVYLVQQHLGDQLGPYPLLMLFLLPVIVAAGYGGFRPGLLSTVLAVLAATFGELQTGVLDIADARTALRLCSFIAVGMVLSVLFERLRRYRSQEDELRRESSELASRLQAVLDSVPHQIFALDDHCRYTYFSEQLLDATQRHRSDVLGRSVWEVFPELTGTAFEREVRRAVATRTPCQFDFYYARFERWLDVHVRPSSEGAVLVVADISERKRTEQALAREQELLRSIFDNIPVMIALFDAQRDELRLNKEFERLTGWSGVQRLDDSAAECFPEAPQRERLRDAMHTGAAGWVDLHMRTRSGRDVETSWATIRLSDERRVGIGLDMTSLRAGDELQARLAAIVESSDDAIIGKTTTGVINAWNAAAERLFGYRASEIIGQPISVIIPPERVDEEQGILTRIIDGAKVEPIETERMARDGRRIALSMTVSPVRDRFGRVVGASTVARDITARKRSEEALRRSEAMLRDFFDNAPVGLHWLGADGVIQRANRAELSMLGYAESDYVGHHISEFHVEQLAAGEFLRRMQAGATIQDYEARLRCRNGAIKHVLLSVNVLRENGQFVHARCFSRDITDRKRAEQRLATLLRLSERLNASLNVPSLLDVLVREAMLLVGADGGSAGLRSRRGMASQHFVHKGEVQAVEREWGAGEGIAGWVLLHKQPYLTNDAASDPQVSADLRARFVVHSIIAVPILASGGEVLGYFEMHNKPGGFDAADRELLVGVSRAAAIALQNALAHRKVLEAEEALRDADRRKDEFLATLAHELRNPLAPIRNAVEFFRTKRGLEADIRWGHEVIQRQVEQLARLVDDLLDMSRVTRGLIELRRHPITVGSIVNHAIETSRPLIEANGHQLTIELEDEELRVDGDLTRLAQVLSNLLNNAAKYTPPGGQIRVHARRDGAQLQITVSDNGIGIPPSMLSRIFDLFAQVDRSLERATGGLGIGLSLVKRLVELHGGSVEARSAGPGKGSEFVVLLPLALGAVAPAPQEPAPVMMPVRPSQMRRILVVDDNRDSANSLAMLLRVLGHEVDVAHDGLEALNMGASLKPDTVLLDIGLPKLNGYDVARRMRQMPWARNALLIAVTGWGQDDDRRRSHESGFDGHLVKPVELEALQSLLRPADKPAARITH